jgi:hypothetical protein
MGGQIGDVAAVEPDASRRYFPEMTLKRLDFPAPLGPITAVIDPAGTAMLTSWSA